MPVIPVDTSEAQDFAPIEPGTYPASITAAPIQQSKGAEGKPKVWMVVPSFAIRVGADEKPRTRKAWLVTQGEGTFGFDQLLRAVNMDELADKFKDKSGPKPDFDSDSLIGQELQVVIDSQIYQPKDASGNPSGDSQLRDRIKTFLKL